MIVSTLNYINDSFSTLYRYDEIVEKFKFLEDNPSSGNLTLELWYLRINNRVIKRIEYDVTTLNSPLTSLIVGSGGQPVTVGKYIESVGGSPTTNMGYDNYTNFINNILERHGISSRFFPMGKNYIAPLTQFVNTKGNHVGCHLSILEDFALTFLEKPTNIGTGESAYNTNTILHIETGPPLSLKSLVLESNPYFSFNVVTNPFNSAAQILINQTDFYTEDRYNYIV